MAAAAAAARKATKSFKDALPCAMRRGKQRKRSKPCKAGEQGMGNEAVVAMDMDATEALVRIAFGTSRGSSTGAPEGVIVQDVAGGLPEREGIKRGDRVVGVGGGEEGATARVVDRETAQEVVQELRKRAEQGTGVRLLIERRERGGLSQQVRRRVRERNRYLSRESSRSDTRVIALVASLVALPPLVILLVAWQQGLLDVTRFRRYYKSM